MSSPRRPPISAEPSTHPHASSRCGDTRHAPAPRRTSRRWRAQSGHGEVDSIGAFTQFKACAELRSAATAFRNVGQSETSLIPVVGFGVLPCPTRCPVSCRDVAKSPHDLCPGVRGPVRTRRGHFRTGQSLRNPVRAAVRIHCKVIPVRLPLPQRDKTIELCAIPTPRLDQIPRDGLCGSRVWNADRWCGGTLRRTIPVTHDAELGRDGNSDLSRRGGRYRVFLERCSLRHRVRCNHGNKNYRKRNPE